MSRSDRIEIIYNVAMSLDGFIAPKDGSVGWLLPFQESGEDYGLSAFQDSVDALLMGSRTYEQVLGFGGDPMSSLGKPTWVFSGRDLPVAGPSVFLTSAGPIEVVDELAARGIGRAWLMGGLRLASSFRAASLISEYAIAVMPVLLGDGIPLFESPGPPARLKLVDSRTHPSGVVQLRYRVE